MPQLPRDILYRAITNSCYLGGQEWVSKEEPTEESTFGRGVWRAQQVAWVRHRKWNRVFAKPGPAQPPFHPLYK
jgi:hypothetical protein